MNININFDNVKEIYGEEIIKIMLDNIDIVKKNIETLKNMNFDDIGAILERCPTAFISFPKRFKQRMENLKSELGKDYVDIIQNDISIIENLV